jgi:hypothetical protein
MFPSAALDTSLVSYIKEHFEPGVAAVYASESADGVPAIIACINSTRVNMSSFWFVASGRPMLIRFIAIHFFFRGGRWKSTWVIELNSPNSSVTGTLSVDAHFFEGGNIHLKTSKKYDATIPHTVSALLLFFFYFPLVISFYRTFPPISSRCRPLSFRLTPANSPQMC